MTTLLMALYAIVMVSGIYGLFLQHLMPRLMKERLPAETVFEQIPHIRSQLAAAAEKMRDSFKPAPPKKPDAGAPAASASKTATAGAPVMGSTKGELSTPVARAKSATGSAATAAPVAAAATTASAAPAAKAAEAEAAPASASIPNAAILPARRKRKRSARRRRGCKAIRLAPPSRDRKFPPAINPRLHRPSLPRHRWRLRKSWRPLPRQNPRPLHLRQNPPRPPP